MNYSNKAPTPNTDNSKNDAQTNIIANSSIYHKLVVKNMNKKMESKRNNHTKSKYDIKPNNNQIKPSANNPKNTRSVSSKNK